MNSLIASGPLPQSLDGAVGGGIVENHKLEVAQGLSENAAYAVVKKGKRVVHGHYNADKGIRRPGHTMFCP